MSENVPIFEALTQAAEYLRKLGSNLKIRSENVIEKRICKQKLRKPQGITKAGEKMLLICDLSKKSLVNVENAIKKMMKASRAESKASEDDRSSCHFFDYNGCQLRISKKIQLSEFLSSKVLVEKMTEEMLERYPIYFDCKLYRSRKQRNSLEPNKVNFETEKSSSPLPTFMPTENTNSDNNKIKKFKKSSVFNDSDDEPSGEYSSAQKYKSSSPIKKKLKKSSSDDEPTGEHSFAHSSAQKSKSSSPLPTTMPNDSDDEPSGEHSSAQKSESSSPLNKKLNKSSSDDEPTEEHSSAHVELENFSDEFAKVHNVDKPPNDQFETGNVSKDAVEHTIFDKPVVACSSGNKIEKTGAIISKNTTNVDKPNAKSLGIDESVQAETADAACETLNDLPNVLKTEVPKNDNLNKPSKDLTAEVPKKNTEKSTFFVKCVDINKLKGSDTQEVAENVISSIESTDKKETSKSDLASMEEYQKVKSKELQETCLHENPEQKTNKINISGQKVTCFKTPEKIVKRKFNISPKSKLYWDSKSQKYSFFVPRLCTVKVNKMHNSFVRILFHDRSVKLIKYKGTAVLSMEEVKRVDNPNYKIQLFPDETQIKPCKHSMALKCSPTKIKRKISEGSAEKKSKRKKIMESMHARKMLLTYSSSSETEDEQLRGVLKEIKEDLMKGISNADDKKPNVLQNVMDKHRRRLLVSSSSDDNEICRSSLIAGGVANQGSDLEDTKKDIDGLVNISSLHKLNRRRRDSTSTSETPENSRTEKKNRPKMSKTPVIDSTTILEAESNSSAEESAPEDADQDIDGGDHDLDDLPEVTLADINGTGALDQLARTDLLDESDASNASEHNKTAENESAKEEEPTSSQEKNVKSKRRKNIAAILSDSEGGSRRKVGKDSSEDESSEPAKRTKKKVVDSDASVTSSTEEPSKKKRRRIQQLDDSDDGDGSGSESETEGKKHGRKNIRKVMGKNQLEEATKRAARREKERVARIAERQKVYNNLEFDESGKPDEVVLEKVILDFDPETKEPLIQVDRGLVKKLKPHQANGIKFMWDACFESVKRIKKDKGSGCILAHCMGLGKTLQVVSLTHTLLTHTELTGVRRVLVVCPLSTVLNWVNEFKMWLKHAECDEEIVVYELSKNKQNLERAMQLQYWYEEGGVCVLGYEMFRNLSADNAKKYRKKVLKTFQLALVDPGPDLVVCDEGHLLKNEKTSLSQSMNRVKTLRRIVLTGTPLQNNLKEYYCMVQFVKPNLLGKYNEYLNRFVNPITNGQYTDSTEHDIRVMKRRSHVLHKMLDGAVQRRDYGVLAPFLPPKHEYVLFITLTEVQTKLYQFYLDNYSRRPLAGKSSGFLFPDFQSLQRIWTHPLVLKYNSERYEIMQQKKREREEEEDSEGSLVDFIDDESTAEETSDEDSPDDLSDASDDSRKKGKKKKAAKNKKPKESKHAPRRGTRANPVEHSEVDLEVVEVKNENPTEWWIKLVTEEELDDMRNSSKLVLLFDILRQCETIGDKLLVFSQSLYSLDLIEHFLGKVDEATQEGRVDEKLGGHVGSWSPGVDYFRLDGSTSCENRSIWCKNFNREDNPRARLFLISTRAGGLGINLVAANRVVIFDVSWNPSHDVQSIFRVYRFGQKKPCYVYRFLAMGTMEEKIYERQVTKQAISKRVIDEQQIDRHYAENDLAELYKFEPRPPEPRPLPPLPRDRLFAEMLREHDKQIYKYHEHDSLLENKEEETLTEEERKAAWEDFENEKSRPPPAPFANVWPMHNAGLMAQQQQQLAYTALAAVLRKDMPNINESQIREILPLVYNANPALMQKMNEIYKYMPPNMMNPGMMNSGLMNAAAAGGGMGSSGLQYEPPWQRQQQQQQQMRLQQLMQQQNQMGAKFYAGGLGSRDPVAMALQQQYAREIGGGEARGGTGAAGGGGGAGAGRPRGRPPLTPRAPPPPAGDVVNLDSD